MNPQYFVILSLFCAARALSQEPTVTLDHATKTISPSTLFVGRGDAIRIQITNTEPRCFLYNASAAFVQQEDSSLPLRALARNDTLTTVDLPIVIHQPQYNSYIVTIERLGAEDCDEPHALGDYTFTVNVQTLGWALDFGGAFYMSDLTSSKYFLEPGKADDDSEGFFVRQNTDVEDSFSRGLSLVIHLKNQKWDRTRNVVWAPITFGVGLSESTDYFAGTSLKFGDAMYLTVGAIFSDVDELPISLKQDEFTSNANALDTLGTKSEIGLFVSFSYAFGRDLASSRLTQLFQATTPPAQDGTPTAR